MNKYKYDFHCHIHEGSNDSRVSAVDYIESLIKKDFTGLLITDHNSFNGYKYIKNNLNYNNFHILKGIEYSTIDAGHVLVIMPDEYDKSEIENKSAKLADLIKYVHENNGILGPAHPFSEPYLSIFSSNKYKDNFDICDDFDFIEVFNAGEKEEENLKALELANKYDLFKTAGSDAHYLEHCGKSYIELDEEITCNNELITYIKNHKPVNICGDYYRNFDREKYDRLKDFAYLLDHLLVKSAKNKCNIK